MQRHLKVKPLLHSEDVARHSASFLAAANLGAISIFITSASRYIGCPWEESVNQVIQVFVFVIVGNKLQADMKFFCEK